MIPRILVLLIFPIFVFAENFPEPYNSEPDKNATPPSPSEAAKLIDLPEGFNVTVFAAEPDVRNPIAMAWDYKGRMWVAENFTYAERKKRFDLDLRDRILILHDEDGDGVAEKKKVFTDKLTMLTSVEVGTGGIWAMCPPQLLFIPDANGDDIPDGKPIVKLDGFTVAKNNYHNFANGLRWGPDGWLYGRCGHSCPGKPGTPGTPDEERLMMEGGIFRYHPTREVVEVITHGTTNPWGHDWDQHGELFFINTVNGHLWHGIPGAHFLESFGADPNPGVYERLDMHADHWHFDTGQHWTKSRAGAANDYGGGHAHIGMMIYQAEQWPASMRNKLYTMNMHGLRTNVERLEPRGCGYVGKHEDDVFLTKDQWFRGIDIRQGPEGSGYMLDWSDTGECHDSTGVHRSSGRIFQISHGTPQKPDLAKLEKITADSAIELIKHPNVWYERQLRRRLTGNKDEAIVAALVSTLETEEVDTVTRLRALWALNAMGKTDGKRLAKLLGDSDEQLRCWAIRLLTDAQPNDSILGPMHLVDESPHLKHFVEMAESDVSGQVRLTLASTLQRLPVSQREALGKTLASRNEDANDHNQPSIVWYGLIPLIDEDPLALARIARTTTWPKLQQWIAHSLAGKFESSGTPLNLLLITNSKADTKIKAATLRGIADAFEGWKNAPRPQAWIPFINASREPELAKQVQELSLLFGNREALAAVKKLALDPSIDLAARQSALSTLIKNQPDDLRQICEQLLGQKGINATAARGLGNFDDPAIGEQIVARYADFAASDRSAVIEILVSRPAWVGTLLEQIAARKIPSTDLAAFHARQIRAFGDKKLNRQLADAWGELRDSPEETRKLIADWKAKLSAKHLATGNRSAGRTVFANACAACHKLYGEGGTIGPDLTGSGRKDLGYLLENIADPGAAVSNDYRMTILTLDDGRVITGVVEKEDKKILTLRQIAGQAVVQKDTIRKRQRPAISMMPDGLLQVLAPDQVRDLIAYLMHDQQVPSESK